MLWLSLGFPRRKDLCVFFEKPDAKIDLERGVVVCETADSAVYAIPEAAHALFGPESYHGYDYGLYYMNLRENAKVRIEAFKNK